MIFSSVEFLLGFLPIFLVIYYLAPTKFKKISLLLGSLFFYAYGEPVYVFLLLGSMLLNYGYGFLVEQKEGHTAFQRRMRIFHVICIVSADILVLLWFKWKASEMGLPLGISFYSFQVISYQVDVYRNTIKAEKSFLKLGTYICMFPQLVAGPLVSYGEISNALEKPRLSAHGFDRGLKTFVWGLFMKVLIADRLAILWHEIGTIGYISISTPLAWLGAFSYSLQLYFDFYGYSLMAVGLGYMLGYSLPYNFRLPYMAGNIREFYRRWHMTLGKFFTKYVYIPLGGSRKGTLRMLCNLLIVWLLTSLWHGFRINYLLWGMLLCFCIMVEKLLYMKWKKEIHSHLYVWLVIPVTWICFAMEKTSDLWIYLGRMFGFIQGIDVNTTVFTEKITQYGGVLVLAVWMATPWAEKLFLRWKNRMPGILILTVLFWVCIWYLMMMGDNPFMYFRF